MEELTIVNAKYGAALQTITQQTDALFTLAAQLGGARQEIAALAAEVQSLKDELAKKPAAKAKPTLRQVK